MVTHAEGMSLQIGLFRRNTHFDIPCYSKVQPILDRDTLFRTNKQELLHFSERIIEKHYTFRNE